MMSENNDLSKVIQKLKNSADNGSSVILRSAVITPSNKSFSQEPLRAFLSLEDMVKLIETIKPKIVYMYEDKFNSEEYVNDELDKEETNPKILQRTIRKWEDKNNTICRVSVSVFSEGILNLMIEESSWFEDFQVEIEQISEGINSENKNEQDLLNKTEKREIREKAIKLSNDPRYSAPKSSKSKKAFLAKELFPDLSPYLLSQITEEAENISWLRGGSGQQIARFEPA